MCELRLCLRHTAFIEGRQISQCTYLLIYNDTNVWEDIQSIQAEHIIYIVPFENTVPTANSLTIRLLVPSALERLTMYCMYMCYRCSVEDLRRDLSEYIQVDGDGPFVF